MAVKYFLHKRNSRAGSRTIRIERSESDGCACIRSGQARRFVLRRPVARHGGHNDNI